MAFNALVASEEHLLARSSHGLSSGAPGHSLLTTIVYAIASRAASERADELSEEGASFVATRLEPEEPAKRVKFAHGCLDKAGSIGPVRESAELPWTRIPNIDDFGRIRVLCRSSTALGALGSEVPCHGSRQVGNMQRADEIQHVSRLWHSAGTPMVLPNRRRLGT
eukprot:3880394-Amphidinium_carterae.1